MMLTKQRSLFLLFVVYRPDDKKNQVEFFYTAALLYNIIIYCAPLFIRGRPSPRRRNMCTRTTKTFARAVYYVEVSVRTV